MHCMERINSGKQLRTLRKHLGISQTVMAKALGVSKTYLQRFEDSPQPLSPALQDKVRKAFDNVSSDKVLPMNVIAAA